jgi:hypothetical protein
MRGEWQRDVPANWRPPVPPPAIGQVVLDLDLATISSGTPERAAFEASLILELALALSCDASRIRFLTVEAGSVLITFQISAGPDYEITPSPKALIEHLAAMIADTTSVLYTGEMGSKLDASAGLVVRESFDVV